MNADKLKLRENTAVVDESSDGETSPLNQEEIRRCRVAYLSRNDSIDSPGLDCNDLSSSFTTPVVESSCLSTIVDALSSDNTGDNIPNESLNGLANTSTVDEQSSQPEIHSPLPHLNPSEV